MQPLPSELLPFPVNTENSLMTNITSLLTSVGTLHHHISLHLHQNTSAWLLVSLLQLRYWLLTHSLPPQATTSPSLKPHEKCCTWPFKVTSGTAMLSPNTAIFACSVLSLSFWETTTSSPTTPRETASCYFKCFWQTWFVDVMPMICSIFSRTSSRFLLRFLISLMTPSCLWFFLTWVISRSLRDLCLPLTEKMDYTN